MDLLHESSPLQFLLIRFSLENDGYSKIYEYFDADLLGFLQSPYLFATEDCSSFPMGSVDLVVLLYFSSKNLGKGCQV